jgi:hypothetical protein
MNDTEASCDQQSPASEGSDVLDGEVLVMQEEISSSISA